MRERRNRTVGRLWLLLAAAVLTGCGVKNQETDHSQALEAEAEDIRAVSFRCSHMDRFFCFSFLAEEETEGSAFLSAEWGDGERNAWVTVENAVLDAEEMDRIRDLICREQLISAGQKEGGQAILPEAADQTLYTLEIRLTDGTVLKTEEGVSPSAELERLFRELAEEKEGCRE